MMDAEDIRINPNTRVVSMSAESWIKHFCTTKTVPDGVLEEILGKLGLKRETPVSLKVRFTDDAFISVQLWIKPKRAVHITYRNTGVHSFIRARDYDKRYKQQFGTLVNSKMVEEVRECEKQSK